MFFIFTIICNYYNNCSKHFLIETNPRFAVQAGVRWLAVLDKKSWWVPQQIFEILRRFATPLFFLKLLDPDRLAIYLTIF